MASEDLDNITPIPSSHLKSYKKKFQNENKSEALKFTSVGIEKEEISDDMYKRVSQIIINIEPEVCLLQMSAKKEIKKHGYTALEVILTELTQMNSKQVVEPIE